MSLHGYSGKKMFLNFSHCMQGLQTMDPSLWDPLINTVIGRQGLSSLPGVQRQPDGRTDRNPAPDPDREPGGQIMGRHPDKTSAQGTGDKPDGRTNRNPAPDPNREPGAQIMGRHPDKTSAQGTGGKPDGRTDRDPAPDPNREPGG
jgi:hypothetical protein